ncbi:LOW QUALITY PROTEIN: cell growth regulator with RING finger domain protein 1 [Pristis pectinata]|uniref:LOW QUALITY PROTEIN: cell growth regulator with RING finger domain protein 1 n=1 Tax=Pristis pectinata TaxID=685728 RepID=UPI00223D48CB|nr:LOW QUALITY PROTEIN: cell growth regulator with RING finger domain protein 1 [Pristis pectinata]
MAAVFLVMLYEYSPLFYITLIFVCFFVTTAVIFGWFVWDIPVIIRNSEETESEPGVLRKRMVQVKNPFALEIIHSLTASVAGGITLKAHCIEKCTLTIYWGCSVHKLHEGLQKHVYCFRIKMPQKLEEAIDKEYLYREEFLIEKESDDEKFSRLPEYLAIKDFGNLPRARYPLVALLTLTEEENRDIYEIISMVTVIHVPDEKYKLACRILYQYLLTAQGHVYDLKRLFISADDSSLPAEMPSKADGVDRKLLEKFGTAEEEFDSWKESSKDCVVCQNAPVNWVLLPCRHACLCDCCVTYFKQCPMCREFVSESFALISSGVRTEDNVDAVENEADDPILEDI